MMNLLRKRDTLSDDPLPSQSNNMRPFTPYQFSTYFCKICLEIKPSKDLFIVERCFHIFCSNCIATYIETSVFENRAKIQCPEIHCNGELKIEDCKPILRTDVFERWSSVLCESSIPDQMKFYCPYRNCSALLLDDKRDERNMSGKTKESECPHCKRTFCARCKVPWHVGIECKEFWRRKKDDKEDVLLMELVNRRKWQRCRKCGFYVEKIDGCQFIRCRCGNLFCYKCGSESCRHSRVEHCIYVLLATTLSALLIMLVIFGWKYFDLE